MEPTKGGVAIKAIIDLEDENQLLVDENDQLKFENDQLRHHKNMLEDAMKAHIDKLKKDIRLMEERDQDINALGFWSFVVAFGFYWMVIYG